MPRFTGDRPKLSATKGMRVQPLTTAYPVRKGRSHEFNPKSKKPTFFFFLRGRRNCSRKYGEQYYSLGFIDGYSVLLIPSSPSFAWRPPAERLHARMPFLLVNQSSGISPRQLTAFFSFRNVKRKLERLGEFSMRTEL